MTKAELIKAVTEKDRKVYAYIPFSNHLKAYVQIVKSDFLKTVKESPADTEFDFSITDQNIYIS
jgi:hypothetical protein